MIPQLYEVSKITVENRAQGYIPLIKETRCEFCVSVPDISATNPTSSYKVVDR